MFAKQTATRPARRTPASLSLQPAAQQIFTEQEQADLRRLYPTALWSDILAAAPGRTQRQIRYWARQQGMERATKAAATWATGAGRIQGPKLVATTPGPVGRPRKSKETFTVATPVLNARVAARTKRGDTTPIGRMLEQLRQLPGGHPRRLAYAQAARTGNGLDAYEAFMNWKPGKETAP